MQNLLLRKTTTETWQALIQESAIKANVLLTEELESYLVFLLMRFNSDPEITMSVLASEYLDAQKNFTASRQESLRDVGDKCLLFSGFFPGRARKKLVTVDYFIKLGRSAYNDLSSMTENALSQLYQHLSDEFIHLMEVLLASWEQDIVEKLSPDDIDEIMQVTGHIQGWRKRH